MCVYKPYSVKAVFFDFGDTLVTLSPSREELFSKSAMDIGLQLDIEEIRRAYHVVDFSNKYSSITINNKKDKHDFYAQYNRQLCNTLGIANFSPELQPVLAQNFETKKRWELLQDAVLVLEKMTSLKIPLALIANWDKGLATLAGILGIQRFFRYIGASQDIGVEKPNSAIFNDALRSLSLSPGNDHILYVGNEYETDVICARAAGLVPVLIDRQRFYPYADCMHFESLLQWYNSLSFLKDRWIVEGCNSIK
jgi:HAD superfamily hydrolase (TIGR01549 family)